MITELKRKPIEGAECAAAALRDLADKLEAGECRSVVAVADLTAEKCFFERPILKTHGSYWARSNTQSRGAFGHGRCR